MHALGESSRIGDHDVIVMPLDMHRSQAGVIPMDQGVGDRLAEGAFGVFRNTYAEKSHHDLFFLIACSEPLQDLLHGPQQRPAEKLVDLDILAAEDLEGDLMGWQKAPQSFFFAEKEQAKSTDAGDFVVGFHSAQGFGQLLIGQVQQRRIPLS